MLRSLITNNCHGWVLYRQFGWKYESPTIALQILPEEFAKFCANLRHYLESELVEYTELSEDHKKYFWHMYGYDLKCPIGLLDDIMVVFQHDESFASAAEKWNRRKERVNYENVAYMLHVQKTSYGECIDEFLRMKLPHSVVITENFDYPGAYRFDVPEGCDCFNVIGNHKLIEDNFSIAEWLEIENKKAVAAWLK